MTDAKRKLWATTHEISSASIDMIAFRLNRIGKLDKLEEVLIFQNEQGIPVSSLCLFIDNFEGVKPDKTKRVAWADDDLHGIPHDKPSPDDFTKLLNR